MPSSHEKNSNSRDVKNELQAEVEGLELALAVARETTEELRRSASVERVQNQAMRVDLSLREDEIAALRLEYRTALSRATCSEAELSEARARIESLETAVAGRNRDLASKHAQAEVSDRGIEERDRQIAMFSKELDRATEQAASLDGEIQAQRALLDNARRAIALRDERIAYLRQTLGSVEQFAAGAAACDALPRPQVGAPPPVAIAPAIALAPAMPEVVAPTSTPSSVAAVETAQAAEAAALPTTDAEPSGDSKSETPEQASAPPAEQESTPKSEVATGAESDPEAEAQVENKVAAEVEVAVEAQATEQPSAAPGEATETKSDETAADAQDFNAGEDTEPSPFFYADAPQLITPIFRYWRDSEIEKHHPDDAVTSLDTLFLSMIRTSCEERSADVVHVWSLGGGDTQTEVRIAALLKEKQTHNVLFHILDSQPKKLRKQRTMIVNGLELQDRFELLEGDLANWPSDAPCDYVLADGAISAAVRPEELLDKIKGACDRGAVFLLADRLGDSTALSPAALRMLEGFWEGLSEKQRKNKILKATDEQFVDWRPGRDDSVTRRLMSLLEERFQFQLLHTSGNLIEAIAGPEYGANFRVKEKDDCKLIDQLVALDKDIMSSEGMEPRNLIAILRTDGVEEPLLLGCAKSD